MNASISYSFSPKSTVATCRQSSIESLVLTYSATLKARSKFFLLSFGLRDSKSNLSGTKLWTKAQNAIPFAHDDEKLLTSTF